MECRSSILVLLALLAFSPVSGDECIDAKLTKSILDQIDVSGVARRLVSQGMAQPDAERIANNTAHSLASCSYNILKKYAELNDLKIEDVVDAALDPDPADASDDPKLDGDMLAGLTIPCVDDASQETGI